MKPTETEDMELIDQALAWLERLRSGAGESEAFFDWLTESPRHVEVFMQAMTLEQRIAAIEPTQWDVLKGSGIESRLANVVPLPGSISMSSEATGRKQNSPSARWAIAAGITVLTIAGAAAFQALTQWQDFSTAVGEQRIVQLPDGSVVNLNTGSRLKVRMSADARDLRLLEGEALFNVQQDVTRPFRVHTRDAVIQAIGTQFNVYRRAHHTTVAVIEGRVRVTPEPSTKNTAATETTSFENSSNMPALSAGEQIDIARDGRIKRHATLNTARVTAWQQRRLMFDENTLTDIVFEFNRYNRRPFRIEDPAAGARRFSGVFNADDPESLAQLLGRDGGLAVERTDAAILVRTR